MAGDVINIKVCSPLKLRSGLTVNCYAICHYSYNLPFLPIKEKNQPTPIGLKTTQSIKTNTIKIRVNARSVVHLKEEVFVPL